MAKPIFDLRLIRNFGTIAHIDAGKTTTTERILLYTGRIRVAGEVHEGTTTMDWMPDERARGITITAAATTCFWRKHRLNILDTPGHVDFTAEVERSLRVLDGALGIFDARNGVEAQSETVWRQADKYRVPRVAFINKMDNVGADFAAVVGEIRTRLHANPLPVTLPIGQESSFSGVVDLLTEEALTFDPDDDGATVHRGPVPDAMRDAVAAAREHLLDVLTSGVAGPAGEALLTRFDAGEPLRPEDFRAALRAATLASRITPVLCGSALHFQGVQPVLDAIVDYLPSPADLPPVRGTNPEKPGPPVERPPDPAAPAAGIAFKVFHERHGDLTYLRLYSGTVTTGQQVWNPRVRKPERLAKIFEMHADQRAEIPEARAGMIVGVSGLRYTGTGDTLCDKGHPILLEPPAFPQTVVSLSIEPKSAAERGKMEETLGYLMREDPTFHWSTGAEGETLVHGMGELHLDVLCSRMKREFGCEVRLGKPRVAYRETVGKAARGEAKVDREVGGRVHFGHVVVEVRPDPAVTGEPAVQLAVTPEQIPPLFHPAVLDGARSAAQSGPLLSYPMIGVRVTVVGGSTRAGDASETGYLQAATEAVQRALQDAQPRLLEPIMRFEITVPETYLGEVLNDLNGRRASVAEMAQNRDLRVVRGHVPLAETFGYTTQLRSLSQGRASCSLEPDRYAPVPPDRAAALLGG